jgi:C2 domain
MLGFDLKACAARATAVLFAAAALTFGHSPADAADKTLTLKVTKIRLLDRVDELSKGDLFARVTIDGEIQSSPVVKGSNELKPDWKISMKVKGGEHKVKLELVDKDVTQDDSIDINRVDSKRDLDFVVTPGCRIEGFSSTYKCGSSITRAGAEKKKADITFSVNVK